MNSARATVRPVSCPILHAKVAHRFHRHQVEHLRPHGVRTGTLATATMIAAWIATAIRTGTVDRDAMAARAVRVNVTSEAETDSHAETVAVAPAIAVVAEAVATAVVAKAVARVVTTTDAIPGIHAAHANMR